MIYPTIGLPSRFSEWCEAIFRALLSAAGGPPTTFVADGLDQISKALLAARTSSALVVVRQPQQALAEALIATKSPVLITLDTPENAVGALMTDYGDSFPQAIRRIANCLSTLLPLMKYDGAFVLRATDESAAFEVAAGIVRHFALDLDEAAIRKVLDELPGVAPQLDQAKVALAQAAIRETLSLRAAARAAFGYSDEDDATAPRIVAAALAPLWAHVNGDQLREVFWHPALLSFGDRPAETAATAIDVTGSRRCLMFGPYIQLPEGPWSCALLVGCAENAVGVGLTMDIFAGHVLNSIDVVVTEPGLFEIEMSFVNPSPDAPIEVRLFSTKATFEGEILAGSIRLTPQRAKRLRTG